MCSIQGSYCKVMLKSVKLVIKVDLPFQGGTSFVDHACYFCLVFVMFVCASVYCCIVVTCWERADLLDLVCDV